MNSQYSFNREKLFFKMLFKKFEISSNMSLDVGCGHGFFTDLLKKMGHESYGIDLDKKVIVEASKNFKSNFLIADSTHLPFSNNTFDFILCRGLSTFYNQILEHSSSQREHLLNLLKNDGFLVYITASNLSGQKSTIQNHKIHEVLSFFKNPKCEVSIYFLFAQGLLFKLFRENAFKPIFTNLSSLLTKLTKHSGYIVCIIKKRKF